jgi:hypothetical protein
MKGNWGYLATYQETDMGRNVMADCEWLVDKDK